MHSQQIIALVFAALVASTGAEIDYGRKLLQTVYQGTPDTVTVTAANPNINAITITLAIPYPQNAYYCNVTGAGLPQQGPFPLTVRVPVGVKSTVIFANITGPIPGLNCTMASAPATSVVQQAASASVQQMINNPSSVVQQTSSGASVVQQQVATSVNQQTSTSQFMNCVANTTSVVQQSGSAASVVQQSTPASTTKAATTVVQQTTATPAAVTVVQQTTPAATTKATPAAVTVVQQTTPAPTAKATTAPVTVVQQTTPTATAAATVVQQTTPTATAAATVVQQTTPTAVVQQSSGRHLLQAGTIEYISNNGSTGQPQLSVLDTTEGVPNISFLPTAAGQVAQFNGALQVAVTTTNNGFGTPYIPYQVDSKLSPQCNVQVNFVGF